MLAFLNGFSPFLNLAIVFTGLALAFISSPGRSLLVAAVARPCWMFTLARTAPLRLTTPFGAAFTRSSCVARRFPAAVRSRPPLAVAPLPPMLVIRPALSRVSRFAPLLTCLVGGLRPALEPPPPAKRPSLSRLYVLAMRSSHPIPWVAVGRYAVSTETCRQHRQRHACLDPCNDLTVAHA